MIPSDRRQLYDELWAEVHERIHLADVTDAVLNSDTQQRHTVLALDATRLPTRNHYVPVMLRLLEDAEETGKIEPGRHVLVESTSGNAGIAVGYLARRLGYALILFLPRSLASRRVQVVQEYMPTGPYSELRPTGGRYLEGMVEAQKAFLARHRDGYRGRPLYPVNHSRRPAALDAFADVLGRALNSAGNPHIDTAVVALGNGTTATGTRMVLSDRATVIGFEAADSAWCFYQKYGRDAYIERFGHDPEGRPHELWGTGAWGVEMPNLHLHRIDRIEPVAGHEWDPMQRRLHKYDWDVGFTSAAGAMITRREAGQRVEPATYLTIFYDPADRY